MTARTVSADDLETLARAAHADIEFDRDYAYATINGRLYRARLAAVPVEMRHCDGCGEDYNAFEESHVGHGAGGRHDTAAEVSP